MTVTYRRYSQNDICWGFWVVNYALLQDFGGAFLLSLTHASISGLYLFSSTPALHPPYIKSLSTARTSLPKFSAFLRRIEMFRKIVFWLKILNLLCLEIIPTTRTGKLRFFALGSAFYYIIEGQEPYPDLSRDHEEEQVVERFQTSQFLNISIP